MSQLNFVSDKIESIKVTIEKLKDSLAIQLRQFEESLKVAAGDIHGRVAERKNLAKGLALDEKVTQLWTELEHYQRFGILRTYASKRYFEVDDLSGEREGNKKSISFSLNSKSYKFIFTDDGYFDDLHSATLSLLDGSTVLLFEIGLSIEHDIVEILSPFMINAFVPGPWVQEILVAYEKYETNKQSEKVRNLYDSIELEELKKKFGLE